MSRMTVEECAKRMHVSPQFVRIGLQKGIFPFGKALKMSRRYTYWISEELYEKFEAGKLAQLEESK